MPADVDELPGRKLYAAERHRMQFEVSRRPLEVRHMPFAELRKIVGAVEATSLVHRNSC